MLQYKIKIKIKEKKFKKRYGIDYDLCQIVNDWSAPPEAHDFAI